ncbi:MAG: alpha-L-fucosidase [Victivallales bacterium]|nr:alpha-L-fucosidase [Victivallales bacterium]
MGFDPDVDEVADCLNEADVDEIITFAKCHTGFSYYPTKIATPHPNMKGDPFGDMLAACRKKDIKVLAYVSFGIDGEAGRRHHDYIQRFAPVDPAVPESGFISVCPFTPYIDDLFLPQVKEIIENYQPDGFFFDTMSAFSKCYCDCCRMEYKKIEGAEIPTDDDDSEMAAYGQFRHDRAIRLIDRVGSFIHELDSDAVIGFNQIGSPPFPEKMPDAINRLTLDFATYGNQSMQSSLSANYGSTAPISSDIMPTRFNQGWGDWSSAPACSLEQAAVPVFAFGERLYMGDRLHPANRITTGTRKALKTLSSLKADMVAAYPKNGKGMRSPDAIILHSPSAVYGKNMEDFALNAKGKLASLNGAHRIMIDSGWNFAVVAEAYLKDWLNPERLLIIPETPAIDKQTDLLIQRFLSDGGRILATGSVPTVDDKPVSWLGLEEEKSPWQDHLYLPSLVEDSEHVLVRGDAYRVKLRGAEELLKAIPPYGLSYGMEMGWGINPPADLPADTPVLTVNKVGYGRAYYIACPLFHDYAGGINYQQKLWLEELLNSTLRESPAQRLLSPFGNVELIPMISDDCSWTTLINHGGEDLASRIGAKPWPRTLLPPAYQVTLIVAIPENRVPNSVLDGDNECEWSKIDGALHIPLIMNSLWKVLKVKWK